MVFPKFHNFLSLLHLRWRRKILLIQSRLRFQSLQIQQLHLPKINWLSLTLQSDVTLLEQFAIHFDFGIKAICYAATNLRLGVLQHHFPIDDVGDQRIPQYDQFGAHPFIFAVSFGTGFDAVAWVFFALKNHIGAGGAHVARGAGFAVAQSSEELHFYGDGPVLFFGHGARVLGVEHHSAVELGVAGGVLAPFVGEAVFDHQVIMRVRLFVVEVAVAVVEFVVLVVAHLDHAILHAEGIAVVVAHFVVENFDNPVFGVFAVEKGDPAFGLSAFFGGGAAGIAQQDQERAQSTYTLDVGNYFFHWNLSCDQMHGKIFISPHLG